MMRRTSPGDGPDRGGVAVDTSPKRLRIADAPEDGAAAEPTRQPAGPQRVEWATVPRVNLLPPEIIDARRFRQVQRGLGAAVLGVIVLLGVAVLWAGSRVTAAQTALDLARNETRALQQQQQRYAEAPKVHAELEAAKAARGRAMGADVLWHRFLTDLAVNTPEGAALSSVNVTTTGSTTDAAATVPFVPAGLGLVTVTGKAGRFTDVAAWLDDVGRVNGLDGTRFSSAARSSASSGGSSTLDYQGTAVITSVALSHRFDRKAS